MDKNIDAQVAKNIEIALITMGILEKRKLGITAGLEGLHASLISANALKDNETLERSLLEMKNLLAKGEELFFEYQELSEWTKENLPEDFQFDYTYKN